MDGIDSSRWTRSQRGLWDHAGSPQSEKRIRILGVEGVPPSDRGLEARDTPKNNASPQKSVTHDGVDPA